jgi:hypothetical protein
MISTNPLSPTLPALIAVRQRFALWGTMLLLTFMAGCGGGSDADGVSSTGSAAMAREFRGTVTEILGPTSFSVEGIPVEATNTSIPPNLAVGTEVQVDGIMANGVITATRIEFRGRDNNDDSRRPNRIEGRVTSYGGLSSFTVNGIPVDASGAERIRGSLAVGVFVDVRGIVVNGVLIANRVRVENDNDDDDRNDDDRDDSSDDNGAIDEIKGRITSYTSAGNFMIGATRVDASGVARLPAGLGVGVIVEMDGRFVNGVFVASTLELDD